MLSAVLYGGLGNQLFIKATTIAHALRHGYSYAIPKEVSNPHSKEQRLYLLPGVTYSDNIPTDLSPYCEPFFHYSPLPPIDNIRIDGYWQSARYFDEYRDEIIEMFGLEIKRILQGWCGVHVRRGDYLRWPQHHPPVTTRYLHSAVWEASKNLGIQNFLVASDDIKWCKDNMIGVANHFEFLETGDEIEDLKTIASCCHQIGSNSSYSWWAHYLNPNPNKVGYFPRKWFGPELCHITKDLYTNSMTVI